jgi:hypothetical protein
MLCQLSAIGQKQTSVFPPDPMLLFMQLVCTCMRYGLAVCGRSRYLLAVTMNQKQLRAKAKRQRAIMKDVRARASDAQDRRSPDIVTFYGAILIAVPAPQSQAVPESIYPPIVPRDKDSTPLVPGDHICKQMDWESAGTICAYWHHGLYMGRFDSGHMVIHYSGNAGPESTGKVEVVPIDEFGEWYEIHVVPHANPKYDREASISRASSRYKENRYNLVSNNCEHFVNWCIEGESSSIQVEVAVGLVLEIGGVILGSLAAPLTRRK